MTALAQYKRLEATGLWRESEEDQRREVVVSLGDATLVISNLTDTALTHWSLPAVERLNPGRRPALYAPATDTEERLEIDDTEMIGAIEKLRSAIARRRPRPGRLRLWIGLASALAAAVLSVTWLPGALTRQTVAMLPDASRAEIGNQLLAEITRLAGATCETPRGQNALSRLTARAFGPDEAPRVVILPSALPHTLALPGGLFVANAALVEDHETPLVLAGHLLAEDVRAETADPILTLLSESGLSVTFRLLTTGHIPNDALRDHATNLLSRARPMIEEDQVLARFAEAEVPTSPYAYALDVSGETTLGLIEADPMRGDSQAPFLTDAEWLSLQEICAE